MTQLEALRDRMTAFLQSQGVPAVGAWSNQVRTSLTAPLVTVSLKELESEASGFQNYLGLRFDEETEAWCELYGQRVKVRFALDLFCPKEEGTTLCQTALNQLADALQHSVEVGLPLQKFLCGEVKYEKTSGLFHAVAEALCPAFLCTVVNETGQFLRFELKGDMTD